MSTTRKTKSAATSDGPNQRNGLCLINAYMTWEQRSVLQNLSYITKVSASELIRFAVSKKMKRDFPPSLRMPYPDHVISHGRRDPNKAPKPIEEILAPYAGKGFNMAPVDVIPVTPEELQRRQRVVLINAFFAPEQREYLQKVASFIGPDGRSGTVADIARAALHELFLEYGWKGWRVVKIAHGKKTDFNLDIVGSGSVPKSRKPRPKPKPKP